MNIKNYKDKFDYMTEKELRLWLKQFTISPEFIEKEEVELAGARHLTDINGPDGRYPNGDDLEIKSQRWMGINQLSGSMIYSSISESILLDKSRADEDTIVVGLDAETGEVYYRFQFCFSVIAEEYKRQLALTENSNSTNGNLSFIHYKDSPSLKILYIADVETLQNNSYKFKSNFFDWLMQIHYRKIEGPLLEFAKLLETR